ncbi:hypothetical protein J4714_13725 [Staphylococcus epidermidis]|nr:hypothetical protein [Staphylococcus epidermidis]
MSKPVTAWRVTPNQPRDVRELHYSDEDSIRSSLGSTHSDKNMLLADGDVEPCAQLQRGEFPIYAFQPQHIWPAAMGAL